MKLKDLWSRSWRVYFLELEASGSSSHPQVARHSCFLINFSRISTTLKARSSKRHLYGDRTRFSNVNIVNLIIKKKRILLGPSISELSSLLSCLEINCRYEIKYKLRKINKFNKSSTNGWLAIDIVWLGVISHSCHKV